MSNRDSRNVISHGEVARVVGDTLVYVAILDENRTLSFVPDVIVGYAGELLDELGVVTGREVTIEWERNSGVVTRVDLVAPEHVRSQGWGGAARNPITIRDSATGPPPVRQQAQPSTSQIELHPDQVASAQATARRALPGATRAFGKLVQTANLKPGDLLLSRELQPDRISTLIAEVQQEGGYEPLDARWTHAAMYVGDDQCVVEATFESLATGGTVRLTSLDEYANGLSALRFRRSKYVTGDAPGWRLCVRALSRLTQPYSFGLIAQIWYNVVVRKAGFYSSERQQPTTRAVVCSTLYADAYNEALRRSLGEVNGACVPAWLSASDEFDDIQAGWVGIA